MLHLIGLNNLGHELIQESMATGNSTYRYRSFWNVQPWEFRNNTAVFFLHTTSGIVY
jgi:hypothetical protein